MKRLFISYVFVCLLLFFTNPCEATLEDAWHTFHTRLDPGESLDCFQWLVPDPDYTGDYDTTNLVFKGAELLGFIGDLDITGWDWHNVDVGGSKDIHYSGPLLTNTSDDWMAFNYKIHFQWEDSVVEDFPAYADVALYSGGLGTSPNGGVVYGVKLTPGDVGSLTVVGNFTPVSEFSNPAPEPTTVALLGLGSIFLFRWRRING
ncbi:MAG: PEP-CTERM sorting domain-containing protein [Planctomycetota bacterium]